MYVRHTNSQPELVVVGEKESDRAEIKCMKQMIRQATLLQPESRPTAGQVYHQLEHLSNIVSELVSVIGDLTKEIIK